MTTLLEKVAASEAADREKAAELYRTILLRSDTPEKGDEKLLRHAMADLGKSAADLERDLQIVQRAAALEKLIADGSDPETLAADTEAGRQLTAHLAETQKIIAQRRQEENEIYVIFQTMQRKVTDGQTARRELSELEFKHPDLFGQLAEAAG